MVKKHCFLSTIILALLLSGCGGGTSSSPISSASSVARSSRPESSSVNSSVVSSSGVVSSQSSKSSSQITSSSSSSSKSSSSSSSIPTQKVTLVVVGGNGSGDYDVNSEVTVIANRTPGQTFNHWEIDGQSVSTESTYSFILSKNTTIVAKFDGQNPMANYTTNITMKGDSFKILNLADIQVHNGNDLTLTNHILDTLVEQQDPDMIVVLGDTINDSTEYNSDQSAIDIFSKIDSYDIPWAPIFGNHDTMDYNAKEPKMKQVGIPYLMNIFATSENCLFIEGPSSINVNGAAEATSMQGKSNYMVNVNDTNGNLVESLIFLDAYTSGLNQTNEQFYKDCIAYSAEFNDGIIAPSVVFSHIPIAEYQDSYDKSLDIECHDAIGVMVSNPLDAGENTFFDTMKKLGSTKTMICGHDHENQFILDREGIKLAYGMKSSDGDNDEADYIFKHPLGGLMLTLDGENPDRLDYARVEDISYTVVPSKNYDFHAGELSYWKFSGAKLVFDVELPTSGKIQFNLQGTNLMRTSRPESERKGAWNRLTGNVDIVAGTTPTVDFGTLTQIEGNKYHYELDISTLNLNKSASEVAYGDETARHIFFHDGTANFKFTNIHWEYEVVTETNQKDLAGASIADIGEVVYEGAPARPKPTVTLGGETLVEGTDIIYTYTNNRAAGEGTLTIIPSGKGAHNYKGSVLKTFTITENTLRGEPFEKGYQHSFKEKTIATDTLEFDVHFTSTGDNTMKFMIGDGWDSLFGYYGLKNNGALEENYSGITVQKTTDDYYHVTCVLSQLNKQNGDTPKPTSTVNLFYIHGSWGNNPKGYIDFDMVDPPEVYRGQAFAVGENKTFNYSKLTYDDSITVDFKFTSAASTRINFSVGNTADSWARYFGYYKFNANGTLGDNYNGISVSTTADGYYRLTIVLAELTKKASGGAPTEEEGFNFFYIRGDWSDAAGYVDFDPQEKPVKTKEFTMKGDNFVIANFTDIHVDNEDMLSDTGTVGKTIKYGIKNSNPDIMVFSGDIAGSSSDLDYILEYLDQFEIPYFFILGNHDHEGSLGYDTFESYVNKSQYGYIEKGPTDLGSQGNYTIKINNSEGELVHALVLMDTGNKTNVSDESKIEYVSNKVSGVKYGTYNSQTTYCDSTSGTSNMWDGIKGNQIEWYKDTVEELDCQTTLICHAPINEYVKAFEQYQDAVNKQDSAAILACAPIGQCNMGEQSCGPIQNFGLFDAILEMDSTKNVICGHDHSNDFSLLYEGVRLTYALKTGNGAYWSGGNRSGYTELVISSDGSTTLDQVYFNPLS